MSDPKNSGHFAKPRKIAKKFANPEKIGFGQISYPKRNRTSIPVKILTCAPRAGLQTLHFESFYFLGLNFGAFYFFGGFEFRVILFFG